MSVDTRTPLLTDRERIYSYGEHDHERRREDSTDSQLTALADQLGFQADAFSGTSSERENNNPSKRGRDGPINDSVVTISHEQLEELLTALETTSDLIKQVGMNSVELENLTRRRRWVWDFTILISLFGWLFSFKLVRSTNCKQWIQLYTSRRGKIRG